MVRARIAGVALALGALAACDYTTDQVAVGKGTGIFRGWDHTTCECEFDDGNVSMYCSPLFDGKDGFGGFIYLVDTPVNEPRVTSVWNYDGMQGVALMEITSETAEFKDDTWRAVFVDRVDVPEQDACTTAIGGYYYYYYYDVCVPYAGGTLEDVRMWCKEPSGYAY